MQVSICCCSLCRVILIAFLRQLYYIIKPAAKFSPVGDSAYTLHMHRQPYSTPICTDVHTYMYTHAHTHRCIAHTRARTHTHTISECNMYLLLLLQHRLILGVASHSPWTLQCYSFQSKLLPDIQSQEAKFSRGQVHFTHSIQARPTA